MRFTRRALPFTFLALAISVPSLVLAQETKTARGTVTAVTASALTINASDLAMTFSVDADTVVTAEGAGTASRRAATGAAAGPKLTDFVKVGEAVEVSYRDMSGTMRATNVRRVSSAAVRAADATETSTGSVTAVSGSSLTITGSTGGGGKFTQTFAIDTNTRIIGQGAGTAAAAKGGKLVATDYIAAGDAVRVSFQRTAAAMVASEIRVTFKAKK